MITIDIKVKPDFSRGLLDRAAKATLAISSQSRSDLTILLTDDEEVASLNKKYLDKASPTDVLSFPAGEIDPENGRLYLGDVIISLPRALEQAASQGHEPEAEVQLLVVHGILHLLGFDHVDPLEKARMWRLQAEILTDLGLERNIPD
jgi:probable rRNA maturation factor